MNTERKSVRIFGMRDHFFPKYRTVTVFIDDYRFFFELGGQVMGDRPFGRKVAYHLAHGLKKAYYMLDTQVDIIGNPNRIIFRIFFGYFSIRKSNTAKPSEFRFGQSKSDVSGFVNEKIYGFAEPEAVQIGYFRRKVVYFRC